MIKRLIPILPEILFAAILAALLFAQALAASFTLIPTANQSPDATLGGNAVTSPTNTGHANTGWSAGGGGGNSISSSCRWHTFQSAPAGTIAKITLKFDHTSSGVLNGAGASNSFIVSYTLDGGSSWNSPVVRIDFTAAQGPTTFSIDLPTSQNISLVQVRDGMTASVVDPINETANVFFTMANIKLEVTTVEGRSMVIMMEETR